MEIRKGSVIALIALTILSTTGFVFAAGPTIQKVFVTNWPGNQNVTVTNKPFLWAVPLQNGTFPNQSLWNTTLSAGGYQSLRLNFVATFVFESKTQISNYSFYEPAIPRWFNGTYCSYQSSAYDTYRVDVSNVVPGKGAVLVTSQVFSWNPSQTCSQNSQTLQSQQALFQIGFNIRSPNLVVSVFYQRVQQQASTTVTYTGYTCPHRPTCTPNLTYMTIPTLTYPPSTGTGVYLSLYAVE